MTNLGGTNLLTLIVILGAGIVMFFLWKTLREYLSNDENSQRFNQQGVVEQITIAPKEPTFEDKIKKSEYGILTGILGYVANADGEICELEKAVALSLIDDMVAEMGNLGGEREVRECLQNIFFSSNKDIQALTQSFVYLTKGEYKKKVKVVEFCFVLGYADGELNEPTKEAIIDIGALLGLDNEDFNALYNGFEKTYEVTLSLQEAKEIFGSCGNLENRYHELISKEKQNILQDRYLNKPFSSDDLLNLRKIQKAYELLKHESVE